jgi:hypothetical protein
MIGTRIGTRMKSDDDRNKDRDNDGRGADMPSVFPSLSRSSSRSLSNNRCLDPCPDPRRIVLGDGERVEQTRMTNGKPPGNPRRTSQNGMKCPYSNRKCSVHSTRQRVHRQWVAGTMAGPWQAKRRIPAPKRRCKESGAHGISRRAKGGGDDAERFDVGVDTKVEVLRQPHVTVRRQRHRADNDGRHTSNR